MKAGSKGLIAGVERDWRASQFRRSRIWEARRLARRISVQIGRGRLQLG